MAKSYMTFIDTVALRVAELKQNKETGNTSDMWRLSSFSTHWNIPKVVLDLIEEKVISIITERSGDEQLEELSIVYDVLIKYMAQINLVGKIANDELTPTELNAILGQARKTTVTEGSANYMAEFVSLLSGKKDD